MGHNKHLFQSASNSLNVYIWTNKTSVAPLRTIILLGFTIKLTNNTCISDTSKSP